MSYAYDQLRLAMQYLAQSGSLHDRLAKALNELLFLRPKDMPVACRNEFCSLSRRFSPGPMTKRNAELVKNIESISDQEAYAIVQMLLHLFDTVTRYQPLPSVNLASPSYELNQCTEAPMGCGSSSRTI